MIVNIATDAPGRHAAREDAATFWGAGTSVSFLPDGMTAVITDGKIVAEVWGAKGGSLRHAAI